MFVVNDVMGKVMAQDALLVVGVYVRREEDVWWTFFGDGGYWKKDVDGVGIADMWDESVKRMVLGLR